MGKRMEDTEKFNKMWHRNLPAAYKIFWDYLNTNCNFAGIWEKDFDLAQLLCGKDAPINEQEALKLFNEGKTRIIPFADNTKWFIAPFIPFQYKELTFKSRVHVAVIDRLKKYGLYEENIGLTFEARPQKPKSKRTPKPKTEIDIGEFRLFKEVTSLFDEKYFNLKTWSECYAKLIRSGYTEEQILQASTFGRTNDFWKTNFLSFVKLDKTNKEKIKFIDVFLEKSKSAPFQLGQIIHTEDGKKRGY